MPRMPFALTYPSATMGGVLQQAALGVCDCDIVWLYLANTSGFDVNDVETRVAVRAIARPGRKIMLGCMDSTICDVSGVTSAALIDIGIITCEIRLTYQIAIAVGRFVVGVLDDHVNTRPK